MSPKGVKSNARSGAGSGRGSSGVQGQTATYTPVGLPSGNLNRRISIMQHIDIPDAGSGDDRSWKLFATCWASMKPQPGHEIFHTEQVEEQLAYVIRIRYRKGIDPSMRVYYKNRIMEIRSVMDVMEEHKEIQLLCQELQAQGVE